MKGSYTLAAGVDWGESRDAAAFKPRVWDSPRASGLTSLLRSSSAGRGALLLPSTCTFRFPLPFLLCLLQCHSSSFPRQKSDLDK